MNKKIFHLSSTALLIAVSLYFAFFLNISFWNLTFHKVEINNFRTLIFAISLPFFIFIPLFVFFCLTAVPFFGKPLIILLLILSAAADYAMTNLGIVIDSDMVRNFFETNLREARDLITLRAVLYVTAVGIVPSVLLFFTDIRYDHPAKEAGKRLFYIFVCLSLLGIFAFTSYKEYASFGRNNSESRRYINTFNYIYAVGRYYQKKSNANREFVILDPRPEITKKSATPRLLILVIGETARAKNFSLYGYAKQTNPLLEKQDIITFRDVSSCGTATALSLPCMFSADGRKNFNVSDAKYTQNLLDIIQAAGYHVSWKDNDDGCKGVCERIENSDAKDGNKQPYCFGSYCHDDILLDGLEQKAAGLTADSVIVLHMMGSHGPTYYKRYPEKFRKFRPACDTADLQNCRREDIVNTYDNTILYTDYVLSSIIDLLKKYPNIESGMIYVSDHGESLGENNIYLHGFPYAVAPEEQKKVPMIMWLSERLQQAVGIDKRCLMQNAAQDMYSHDNFFHSVLRLLEVRTSTYDRREDLFDACIS